MPGLDRPVMASLSAFAAAARLRVGPVVRLVKTLAVTAPALTALAVASATSVFDGGSAAGADPAASIVFTGGSSFSTPAITLSGTVQANSGLVVEVDLAVQSGGGPPAAHTALFPESPGPVFPWSWSPALSFNGSYTLTAVALTAPAVGDATSQTQATTVFVVAAPPQVPSGVVSAVDPASRTASLAWAPNPEPDLVSYLILRAGPGTGAAFAPINIVAASTRAYTDTEVAVEPPGLYRYAVVAIRSGGPGNRTVPSRQSAPTAVVFTTPALAGPKAWGHPTVGPPATGTPGASQAGTPGASQAGTPGASQAGTPGANHAGTPGASQAGTTPATTTPTQGPAATTPSAGTTPTAGVPAAPAVQAAPQTSTPPGTSAQPGAGELRVTGGGGTRRTALDALAGLLILCVLVLFIAVRRGRHGRDAPLDALEPDALLDHLGGGVPITVGEALARRAASRGPDEPVTASPSAR
jgi:hypothetical protein